MRDTLALLTLALTITAPAFGHGGGLDANGGHHDRKNGDYHYHGGGSTSATQRSYSNAGRLSSPLRQEYERAAALREYESLKHLKEQHDQAVADERKAARLRSCKQIEDVGPIGTRGKDTLRDLFTRLYPNDGYRPLDDGPSTPETRAALHATKNRNDLRDALVEILLREADSHEAGEAFDSITTLDDHAAAEMRAHAAHEAVVKAAEEKAEKKRHVDAHAEAKATARLHMAQRMLDTDHLASGRHMLQRIIEEHGKTKAAEEARQFLAKAR